MPSLRRMGPTSDPGRRKKDKTVLFGVMGAAVAAAIGVMVLLVVFMSRVIGSPDVT